MSLPNNIGPNTYALLQGLSAGIAAQDAALQQVLGAMRLQSSQGASIDSFAYDVFGGLFYRFAQYGETDAQFIARIQVILGAQKATIPGMQTILNAFWPWIILQFGAQNLSFDTGIGGLDTSGGLDVVTSGNGGSTIAKSGQAMGVDTYGGLDTGATFMDVSNPRNLPPIPIIFDSQSNPTLSVTIQPNIVPLQFCVYTQYGGYADSLIRPIVSPSLILSQLMSAIKASGVTVVYATNK